MNDTTFRDISDAIGLSIKTLKKLWERPDAPPRSRPWPELCKWAREATRQLDAPAQEGEPLTITQADLAIKKRRSRKLDQDLEKGALEISKLRGEMVPIIDVRRDLVPIGEMIASFFMKDAKEHGVIYSDKLTPEIDAIAVPRAAENIKTIKAALANVGKAAAAELGRESRLEKYGVDS